MKGTQPHKAPTLIHRASASIHHPLWPPLQFSRTVRRRLTPLRAAASLGSEGLEEETRKTDTSLPSALHLPLACVQEPHTRLDSPVTSNGSEEPVPTRAVSRANMPRERPAERGSSRELPLGTRDPPALPYKPSATLSSKISRFNLTGATTEDLLLLCSVKNTQRSRHRSTDRPAVLLADKGCELFPHFL